MKSEKIGELAKALAKAQGELKGAKKESTNPFFKAKYADLESVWDSCRLALSSNGLSVTQFTGINPEGGTVLTTCLMHESGEWVEGYQKVTPKDDSPQALGSAITYTRRYGLAAMIGVYQTDDDAETAMSRQTGYQTSGYSNVQKATSGVTTTIGVQK